MSTVIDLFDPLLSLEDTYYQEGYQEGVKDGEAAGRIEGRLFGLEKGFDKFLELGRLQGRLAVWKARIPNTQSEGNDSIAPIMNPRLIKHISQFENIVSSPSTVNDEESVEDVEDSLKRGRAKMKIICNMLGEKESSSSTPDTSGGSGGGEPNIEEGNFKKNVRR